MMKKAKQKQKKGLHAATVLAAKMTRKEQTLACEFAE